MNQQDQDACSAIATAFGLLPTKAMDFASKAVDALCETKAEMDKLYKKTRARCFDIAKTTGESDARKNKSLQSALEQLAKYFSMSPQSKLLFVRTYLKDSEGKWKSFDWKRVPENAGWYD